MLKDLVKAKAKEYKDTYKGKGGPGDPSSSVIMGMTAPTQTPQAAPQLPPIPTSGVSLPKVSGKPKAVPASPPKN